ncbi:hypothetical protein GDO86_019177 [Hymenochirus boettgeri]|uniref:Olfactory receptor n=1 Tax=Hymenochirus boettgeri TaxID=247094 RepID=A0A8T2IHB6_9PIPI|nr:hypothetical protein GDO86_019177 [Hymenochirus boettgeri]
MCDQSTFRPNVTNVTRLKDFVLTGIEGPQSLKLSLLFVLLILYIMTICGNLVIIILFLKSQYLNSPLYLFLSNLSLCDILLSTSVVPNLLYTLLRGRQTMSLIGCIIQMSAIGLSTGAECILLTVMSYDRYLAICNPLHYITIMTPRLCSSLVLGSWLICLLFLLIIIIVILNLEFCGCNVIDYIYFDIPPLFEISCKNRSHLQISTLVMSVPTILFPFLFIMVTYVNIFLTIFQIPSNTGRKKAFSTCSSHLTVVCTYFGVLTSKYIVPLKGGSLKINKIISLLYTGVTPLLNAVIYSLRSKEIRAAATKLFKGRRRDFW